VLITLEVAKQPLKVAVGVPKENAIKGIVFGELSDIYVGSVA